MSERWIVRVEGKEYGPADLSALREWKEEGRVLSTNEVRPAERENWMRAGEIPGLFSELPPEPPPVQVHSDVAPPPGLFRICFDSLALYIRGFFPFLGLTLLVLIPSVVARVTSLLLDDPRSSDMDAGTVLVAGFTFCLSLAAWPLYIAGIQILTAELALGRRLRFFALLNSAVKFWPRVAVLCLLVYLAFVLGALIPMAVIFPIALAGPSPISFFLVLMIGAIQVWIVSRLFINFLFWQQTAVLDERDIAGALRESRALARSGQDLPWFKKPLWQGVLVSSLWFLFVLALNLPALVPAMREYWHIAMTTQDPKVLFQTLSSLPKSHEIDRLTFALWLVGWILRPLLGIAFVLIFFAARARTDGSVRVTVGETDRESA
jgi:GYF domain 2